MSGIAISEITMAITAIIAGIARISMRFIAIPMSLLHEAAVLFENMIFLIYFVIYL